VDTDVLEEHAAKRKRSEFVEYNNSYSKISNVYPKLRNADVNTIQNSLNYKLFNTIGILFLKTVCYQYDKLKKCKCYTFSVKDYSLWVF
jgi:hypothetical protein